MDLFCQTGIIAAGFILCLIMWLSCGVKKPQRITRFLLFVGGSLFIYWLIISGAERCFLPEQLFRFTSGTVPFLRPVCLSVCLIAAAAISTTERGLRLCARLGRHCGTLAGRWITAILLAGLFFFWTTRITVISYLTNDDPAILSAIANAASGNISDVSNAFSHPLFCYVFSLLYRLMPGGYWYVGYHLLAVLGSVSVISFCILTKFLRRGISVLYGIPVCCLTCFAVFLYGLSCLSFTLTPSLVGSAAAALMLCRRDFRRPAAADAAGCILMLLCILQRHSVWQCTVCFWALAAAYQAVCTLIRDTKKRQSLIALALCAGVCIGLSAGVYSIDISGNSSADTESPYAEDYATAEYYRSLVMDFLLDSLTEEDYAAAGIPQELATMLHLWYFMDERICTDSLRCLVESYYERTGTLSVNPLSENGSPQSDLSDLLTGFFGDLTSGRQRLSRTALAVGLLLICLVLLLRKGKSYLPEFLTALCAVGGALILCLYLYIEGRFIFRAYLVVIHPCITTLLLMALSTPKEPCPARRNGFTLPCICLLTAAAVVLCFAIALFTPLADEYSERDSFFEVQHSYEDYLFENDDYLIVQTTFENNLDPFHTIEYPRNYVLWGYCGATAERDRLYADCFFRDDIRFVSHSASYLVALLQYLSVDCGPVQALQLQTITSSLTAYDIDPVTPGDRYTGWYEQNGYTYYFENGHALTGSHIIDGVEYEFAPAGAQSTFSTVFTDGGMIYSTNAYSLLTQQ